MAVVTCLPPLLACSCPCCYLGKLFPLFVFKLFSLCQGLCRQNCLDRSESPIPLKTAQTLTQPFVPSWGSRILLPLLGAGGGIKADDEQLAWPVMLGASAGADFNRCFAQAFFSPKQKPDLYLSSSQRHAGMNKCRYPGPPRSWYLPRDSAVGC